MAATRPWNVRLSTFISTCFHVGGIDTATAAAHHRFGKPRNVKAAQNVQQEYLPRCLTQGRELLTGPFAEPGPTMAGGEGASGPNKIKGGNWTVVRFFTVSVSNSWSRVADCAPPAVCTAI